MSGGKSGPSLVEPDAWITENRYQPAHVAEITTDIKLAIYQKMGKPLSDEAHPLGNG